MAVFDVGGNTGQVVYVEGTTTYTETGWGRIVDRNDPSGNTWVDLSSPNETTGEYNGFGVQSVYSQFIDGPVVDIRLLIVLVKGGYTEWPSLLSWTDDKHTFDETTNWTLIQSGDIAGETYTSFILAATAPDMYADATDYNPQISTGDLTMADIFQNRTSDYDGSASPITATGPVRLTITGTWDGAILTVHSRSTSNTGYEAATIPQDVDRPRIALASGDSYYYVLENVGANTSLSLTDAPA